MDLFTFYPGQSVIDDDGERGTYIEFDESDGVLDGFPHRVHWHTNGEQWSPRYGVHPDGTATVTYDGPGPGWRELGEDEDIPTDATVQVVLRGRDGAWLRGWVPAEIIPTDVHRTAAMLVDRMGVTPERALVIGRAVVAAGGFE